MNRSVQYNQTKIHFGKLAHDFNQLLKNQYSHAKKIIITDDVVFKHWGEYMVTEFSELSKAEVIQFSSGEENKTIEVSAQIWAALSEYEISRNDLIINLGGGVVTDMGGFVASLFKRGLPFINIPTSLLAQVDASVGGKTAVDLGPYKNQIGLFSDPDHVFIDDQFLKTLEKEQLISGYAEMLKHALIADSDYWQILKKIDPLVTDDWLGLIERSVKIKKTIVEKDHKESGIRKVLNFGHSIGHAIEGYLLKNASPILHGNAVAWGMVVESEIAVQKGILKKEILEEVRYVVKANYPAPLIQSADLKKILQLVYNDKKNKEGQLLFSFITEIGKVEYDVQVTDKEVLDALKVIESP